MTYYLETKSTDPAYNLSFEEYVLHHRRDGSYLILWQNANAVIVGRNQNAAEEINESFVREHGISVVRRNTGGGAVYHDLGNLNYSFITDAGPLESRTGSLFTSPVVRALRELGLETEASGRNDILVSGQKVSGTAEALHQGRILHHGTLLFDSDPTVIAGALNPDPTKFQSKSVKSVRSRVGNIRPLLPVDMTLLEFWNYLKTALSREGIVPVSLTEAELAQIQALKETKYHTWQWNFGRSPKYALCNKRRFPGGLLEFHLSVSEGKISQMDILGDFLSLADVAPLARALEGCAYRRSDIEAVLARFPLSTMLGSITEAEFLQTILNED